MGWGDRPATRQKFIKELLIDMPISLGISIAQRRTANLRWQPEVIELVALGGHCVLDIPKTVLAAGLGVEQSGELAPGGQFFGVAVSLITIHQGLELMSR